MALTLKEETFETLKIDNRGARSSLNWPHVFVHPAWLKSWWESFGSGFAPWLRSVWENGELIGIAPLMTTGESVRLVGSNDVCDYLDFICCPGREGAFFEALLPSLADSGFRRLDLEAQRPEAVCFKWLAERGSCASSVSCRAVEFSRANETFELPLPADWEKYLSLLNKKQRHEVRRKLRRLERETASYRYQVISEKEAVCAFTDAFFALLQHHPDKLEFLTPQMEGYFRSLIINTARADLARFGVLEIDGVTAAAVLYFDYRRRIYLYNSGFIPEYGPLSAGLLSKVLLIKEAIARGSRVYDFLKGQEIYKSRLGGTAVPVYDVAIKL